MGAALGLIWLREGRLFPPLERRCDDYCADGDVGLIHTMHLKEAVHAT